MSDDAEIDDVLRRAGQALGRAADVGDPGPAGARSAILARIQADRQARARRVALAVPLLIVGIASTAAAAATGVLPKWLHAVRVAIVDDPRPPAVTAVPVAQQPQLPPRQHPSPPPQAPVAEPVVAPPTAVPPDSVSQAPAPPVWVPHPIKHPAPPPPAPAADALGLFRTAQRLQFDQKDWPAALQAWQAYLAAQPHGELEPEARWNRALCLVHLGRTTQARHALAPFAAGDYGGYQQAKAQQLVTELAAKAGSDDAVAP